MKDLQTNHTPGPWTASISEYADHKIMAHHGQLLVAEVSKMDADAKTEANARLIAAAPELLYQLQTAIRHIENIQNKYKPDIPFAVGGYIAAVKKAIKG